MAGVEQGGVTFLGEYDDTMRIPDRYHKFCLNIFDILFSLGYNFIACDVILQAFMFNVDIKAAEMQVEQLKKDIADRLAVYGYREVAKFISEGNIAHVVIATDAENTYKDKIVRLCDTYGISYRFLASREELGNMAKLDVGCAVIGCKKRV